MAPDVTWVQMSLSFQVIFLVYPIAISEEVRLTTTPYYHDEYFFELTAPEELSFTYKVRPAKNFGVPINTTFYNIRLVPSAPSHGCSDFSNIIYIRDALAFVERGGCSFLTKTINAEAAGALGVIVYDHDRDNDGRMIDMIQDETTRVTNIPAFFLLGKDGHMIISTLHKLQLDEALINIPINVTGIPLSSLNQPPWTLW